FASLLASLLLSHPSLHSFPTRRSSDLSSPVAATPSSAPPSPSAPSVGTPAVRSIRHLAASAPRTSAPAAPAIPSTPVTVRVPAQDRKSTRLNSSHGSISYAVFCLKKKK